MTSHITDSEIYGAGFGSSEMAAIWSDTNRVQMIEQLLDPADYIGLAPKLVDVVAGG